MAFPKRVVSLLPSATEIVFELGQGERLMGVTHECDYPEEAKGLPRVVRCALKLDGLTPAEVDKEVSNALREGREIYEIDMDLIEKIKPDLIITQQLCDVCSVSGNLAKKVSERVRDVEFLELSPRSLGGILKSIKDVADGLGVPDRGLELCENMSKRIGSVQRVAMGIERKNVFFMEWIDPVYCSGHWIPDMMQAAGCYDLLARPHQDSVRIPFEQVIEAAPEIIFVGACGLDAEQISRQFSSLSWKGVDEIPAFVNDRVFAVNANAYFTRPGPRVAQGVELLAYLAHGSPFTWRGEAGAFSKISLVAKAQYAGAYRVIP